MENNIEQAQDVNKITIVINLSIGEWNAIFGVINAGAFQGVMTEVAESVNAQIRASNVPISQSQRQALQVVVPIQLQLDVVNAIVNIVNGSTGFLAVTQPLIDKIIEQTQAQTTAPSTQANGPLSAEALKSMFELSNPQ